MIDARPEETKEKMGQRSQKCNKFTQSPNSNYEETVLENGNS